MNKTKWIELVGVDQTTEAVCTRGEFLAAHAEAFGEDEIAGLRAMDPEDGFYAFGGGAAPEQWVRIMSTKRAAMLDEIAAGCEAQGAGGIEVQVNDGSDPDSGAEPFSIWAGGDIVGSGHSLDRAIEDARHTLRGWCPNLAGAQS